MTEVTVGPAIRDGGICEETNEGKAIDCLYCTLIYEVVGLAQLRMGDYG